MSQHPVNEFAEAALANLRTLVDVDAVIGNPITTPQGIVIIPVSKVSFGYGSGGSDLPVERQGFGAATGGGVTIQPIGFLVVNGENVQLLQMQSADNTGDRIVNAVPGVLDKLLGLIPKKDGKKPQAESNAESGKNTEL